MTEEKQSQFEGFAIVDVLGHNRYAGYVRTEHFGRDAMFHVATPDRDEREIAVEHSGTYIGGGYGYVPAGTKVRRAAKPGAVRMIGAGSIYMITPCTREAVIAHLDETDPGDVLGVTAPDGTPFATERESEELTF